MGHVALTQDVRDHIQLFVLRGSPDSSRLLWAGLARCGTLERAD